MSKFNLQGANISANSIHIGDKYVYSSAKDFLDKNNPNSFTTTEKELVKIIFYNTTSEQERQDILESLKSIRGENLTVKEEEHAFLNFKSLLKTLKAKGMKVAMNLVKTYIMEKINSVDLDNI